MGVNLSLFVCLNLFTWIYICTHLQEVMFTNTAYKWRGIYNQLSPANDCMLTLALACLVTAEEVCCIIDTTLGKCSIYGCIRKELICWVLSNLVNYKLAIDST